MWLYLTAKQCRRIKPNEESLHSGLRTTVCVLFILFIFNLFKVDN